MNTITPRATSVSPPMTWARPGRRASTMPTPQRAAGQTQRVGESEPADGERGGERQHDVPDQPTPGGRRQALLGCEGEPGAGVGDDSRAAREGEQGEGEANERDVDVEALRDPRADTRKRAFALRAAQPREGEGEPVRARRHSRRTSRLPIATSASSSSTGVSAVAPGERDHALVRARAVVLTAEHVDTAEARMGVDHERGVIGHGDDELADPDLGVDPGRPRRRDRRRRARA